MPFDAPLHRDDTNFERRVRIIERPKLERKTPGTDVFSGKRLNRTRHNPDVVHRG